MTNQTYDFVLWGVPRFHRSGVEADKGLKTRAECGEKGGIATTKKQSVQSLGGVPLAQSKETFGQAPAFI
jgi:hypothetical protein